MGEAPAAKVLDVRSHYPTGCGDTHWARDTQRHALELGQPPRFIYRVAGRSTADNEAALAGLQWHEINTCIVEPA